MLAVLAEGSLSSGRPPQAYVWNAQRIDDLNILGISAYYHDSAAALICDGEIRAAAQEERFTRKKHDFNFPEQAIDYCLAEAGICHEDLDFVAFYDKPLLKFDRLLETYISYAPIGFQLFLMGLPLWLTRKALYAPRARSGPRGPVQGALCLHGAPRVTRGQRLLSVAL